jgi:hypothetical protein
MSGILRKRNVLTLQRFNFREIPPLSVRRKLLTPLWNVLNTVCSWDTTEWEGVKEVR